MYILSAHETNHYHYRKIFFIIQAVYFLIALAAVVFNFLQTEKLKQVIDFYFTQHNAFALKPLVEYAAVPVFFLLLGFIKIISTKYRSGMIYETLSDNVFERFLKLQWYDVYMHTPSDTVKLINNDVNKVIPVTRNTYRLQNGKKQIVLTMFP